MRHLMVSVNVMHTADDMRVFARVLIFFFRRRVLYLLAVARKNHAHMIQKFRLLVCTKPPLVGILSGVHLSFHVIVTLHLVVEKSKSTFDCTPTTPMTPKLVIVLANVIKPFFLRSMANSVWRSGSGAAVRYGITSEIHAPRL